MTTFETVPSFTQLLYYKVGKALAKKEDKATTLARTWFQTTVRLVMQLAGFGCLTFAGFSWTITAGWAVAGISCFAISWLTTNNRATQPPEQVRR